jgi:hypothetical protein
MFMPTAGRHDYQRLVSGGAAQNQVAPHITECRRQRVDIGVAVQWGRSQPQAFCGEVVVGNFERWRFGDLDGCDRNEAAGSRRPLSEAE